jgi:D-alanyl-D-alanine carboxypeptidase
VTTATLFPMASTTKELTAVAIMTLVEDGRIRLDQSVKELLPELPQAWSAVTIAHCLSHTSGLPDATTADSVNIIPIAGERDEVLKLAAQRPAASPGVASSYNQMGVLLLAMIIERVSGQGYEAFVEQRLLKPLGISGMAFGDAWAIIPRRSALYTALKPDAERIRLAMVNGQPVFERGKTYAFGAKGFPAWMNAAAGLNASLDAMIAWETALHGGRVVKAETLAEMGGPFQLADGKPGGFGLGLIPGRYKELATVSSGGGAAVWVTTIPEQRLTVIVLTNLQGAFPQNLVPKIFDAFFISGDAPRGS